MWEDMGLYWAWRGKEPPKTQPPTKKQIEYAQIVLQGRYLNGPKQGEQIRMTLAITVFDDDVPKYVNRDELEWHLKHGASVGMVD